MLKVGFDISQIAHIGGVSTYTQNLAEHLSKINDLEIVFFYSSLRKPYRGKLKNVKKYHLPPTLFEVLFNKIRNTNIEKFIGPVDIFHSSDWVQPPSKAKKITTYHDVIPLKYPNWSHPKVIDVHRRRLEIVEKEIDMVIAVSESTKKDLLEITKIPEKKIVVIYEAVDNQFKPQSKDNIEKFKKKYDLPEDFVLAISGVGEIRNLKRVKEAAKNYNLIIAGQDINLINEEMPLLYASAKVLVFPSFYAGFGLPILEAMACGTPVITSNVSSLPEVGGSSALYVDPESLDEISSTLKDVMEDSDLRKQLSKKGLVQAKKFSWEKCAIETANLYKQLV